MNAADAHPGPRRVERLARELAGRVDVLLLESLTDLRYLTGFTGTHGLALVAASPAARERLGSLRLLTDFRYETQSAEQLPEEFERQIVVGELLDAAADALGHAGAAGDAGAAGERGGRLGFDEGRLTVKAYRRLVELLAERWALVGCDGAVARLRSVKEPQEVARIRAAAELADAALESLLQDGIVGRSEREVALELELRMRRLGAEAASFPTIVAAGAHAALPHAEPRDREIPPDTLVTIDWGAQLEGYCSDCTRTYATGEGITAEARDVYELVLAAQERGLSAVKAGPSGREVDAAAREVIEQAGQGEHFGHGLGHGVGLEVHEGPRLSRTAGKEPLSAGQVVTIEPGVYLPGRLGVRIEDLVVIGDDGPDVLSSLPKALTVVA